MQPNRQQAEELATSASQPQRGGGQASPASGRREITIVAGVSDDEHCHAALRVAADLAARLDSRLVLVNVRPSPADLPAGMAAHAERSREQAVESGHRLLAQLSSTLLREPGARRSMSRTQGRVEFGDPAARLTPVVEQTDASLIVVGARDRGVAAAALLGSVSQTLAAGAVAGRWRRG